MEGWGSENGGGVVGEGGDAIAGSISDTDLAGLSIVKTMGFVNSTTSPMGLVSGPFKLTALMTIIYN